MIKLWHRSPVSLGSKPSCNKCLKDIVDCCVTGVNSVDNKEWITHVGSHTDRLGQARHMRLPNIEKESQPLTMAHCLV